MSLSSYESTRCSTSTQSGSACGSADGTRKRVRRACDRCRMKKVKCDGASPGFQCRGDNVICCSKDGQILRRRNLPKGYAEMLEKQQNQLVRGLQELYRRLRKANLWEGELLDESSGFPLTHDILAALDLLAPTGDSIDEASIEQPLSSPVLDEPTDSLEEASTDSSQAFPQPTSHGPAMFGDADPSSHASAHQTYSMKSSLTLPGPYEDPGQSSLQPRGLQEPMRQLSPIMFSQNQLDTLWDDSSYCLHAPRMPSRSSSLDSAGEYSQLLTMWPSHMTRLSGLSTHDTSSRNEIRFVPRPSLYHNWIENGIGFDGSDFISEF